MSLLFFDLGSGEILLIVVAIFLIFGPSKIPELARGLGKFINEVKRASEDIKTEINREADRQEREKKLAEYKAQVEKDLNLNSNEEKNEPEPYRTSEKVTPKEDAPKKSTAKKEVSKKEAAKKKTAKKEPVRKKTVKKTTDKQKAGVKKNAETADQKEKKEDTK